MNFAISPLRFAIYGFLILFIGGILGYYVSYMVEKDDLAAMKRTAWKLPEWTVPDLHKDIAIIKEKNLFGRPIKQEQQQEEIAPIQELKEGWQTLGILTQDGEHFVMIRNTSTGEINNIKQGEKLPDDAVIASIKKDSFVIEQDGEKKEIELYPFNEQDDNNE
jgi:type II secretory pathway component PulC